MAKESRVLLGDLFDGESAELSLEYSFDPYYNLGWWRSGYSIGIPRASPPDLTRWKITPHGLYFYYRCSLTNDIFCTICSKHRPSYFGILKLEARKQTRWLTRMRLDPVI